MNRNKKKETEVKKPSFTRRVRAELARIDFTLDRKTFNMKKDDKEKSKEELRHFFLAGASVTDPMKEYHLEFLPGTEE